MAPSPIRTMTPHNACNHPRKHTDERGLPDPLEESAGRMPGPSIGHTARKKLVGNISPFFKISNIFVIMKKWWNTRYFLLFRNVFNNEQYVFELVLRSIIFPEIRLQYCCDFNFSEYLGVHQMIIWCQV